MEKVQLKGHESFSIREGWLTKGLIEIKKDPKLFSNKNANDILGIGTNMVKSLRYWLITTNLIKETKKTEYELTELGELIYKYDIYIEDIFTLYLLHWQIVTNTKKALVWNIFYNKCNSKVLIKKEVYEEIKQELIANKLEFSEKVLIDEIGVLFKTYANDDKNGTPEDNFVCPLAELKLIKKVNRETYQKERVDLDKLEPNILYYIICEQYKDVDSINIEDLLKEKDSVSRLFNLDKMLLNEYLDVLKKDNLIVVNKTAGLNMIYINKRYTLEEIFKAHFMKEGLDEI